MALEMQRRRSDDAVEIVQRRSARTCGHGGARSTERARTLLERRPIAVETTRIALHARLSLRVRGSERRDAGNGRAAEKATASNRFHQAHASIFALPSLSRPMT